MAVWRIRNIESGSLIEQALKSRQPKDAQPVYELPMLEEAVTSVKESLDKPIAVFGDYDVDGICGALILKTALAKAGGKVIVRLPTREEGYGIKPMHVLELRAEGVKTIITVDNGITAIDAVKEAKSCGINVIVTDHHEPKDVLPDCIIVNPKLRKGGFRDYSGAGVAYILSKALLESMGLEMDEDLISLASLATVADVVPLVGPNFEIAREGLLQMRKKPSVGLKALIEVSGINQLNGYAFGWQIGPRINAAGRIGNPMLAYRLLETKDEEGAVKLAKQLDQMNRDRQDMIAEAVEECMENYDGSIFPMFTCEYPSGVVGIVAGRIANEVRRPTIVGRVEDGIVRASGRSIGEFSILNALYEASFRYGIPKKFGGHKKACGLEVEYEQLLKLQKALNEIAKEKLTVEDMTEWIDIDGEISSIPSIEEVQELDRLEPFGEENPEPVFVLSGPVDWIKRGENWQLASVSGVKFFSDPEIKLTEGQKTYLAVSPYINEFNGEREVMARVKDIKESVLTRDRLLRSFREWRKGKEIIELEEAVFRELGFSRTGRVVKSNLIQSETFRKYGTL